MKSKLVNFEIFFARDFPSIEDATRFQVKKDIDNAVADGYECIIGLILADGFLFKNNKEWNNVFKELVSYGLDKGLKKVLILSGMSHDNDIGVEQIKFNFHLHTVYNSYKDKKLKSFNPISKKFLFLGGVPDRPNRIGLLYKLHKRDLLKNCVWSFFKPWTAEQEQRSLVYFESHDHYNDFVNSMERKVDDLYDSSKTYGTSDPNKTNTSELVQNKWSNDSGWIDPAIYANTGISLISEGNPPGKNNNSKFLTEKTYRVFAQGHPFLLAANPEMFKYVKELGFRSFENYFPNSEYGLIDNEDHHLEKIIENLEFFLNNQIDFKNDIEYNRSHFFKVAEENSRLLDQLVELGVDQQEIDFYFNRKGFGHLLRVIDKGN